MAQEIKRISELNDNRLISLVETAIAEEYRHKTQSIALSTIKTSLRTKIVWDNENELNEVLYNLVDDNKIRLWADITGGKFEFYFEPKA